MELFKPWKIKLAKNHEHCFVKKKQFLSRLIVHLSRLNEFLKKNIFQSLELDWKLIEFSE